MSRNLILWFVYTLVVSALAAFVAGSALAPGATKGAVFHFVAITAFIGYSVALWQMWIWYMRSGGTTFKATVDGLIYALLTAAIFVWLWPH
jgi:hypothetical protein